MHNGAGLRQRPSRREVIRLGVMASGAAWAAPTMVTLAATPAGANGTHAHSLPVCCLGPNLPPCCGLTCIVVALCDGNGKWYLVKYDVKTGTFTCGKSAGISCPTTYPDVVTEWNSACKTTSCPPGLGAIVHPDKTITITFSSTLSAFAFEVVNGPSCFIWGITPHRGALESCSYLPHCGMGSITFPLAPCKCTCDNFPDQI